MKAESFTLSNHCHVRSTDVDDIEIVERKGPWLSKSGGRLQVSLALSRNVLKRFLDYDNPSFDEIPEDVRGFRTYIVSDIPKGGVGGKEWHKARTEFLTVTAGSAVIDCVDLDGNEKEFTLDSKTGIIVPPRILHTYQALEDHTSILVLANTLFFPDNELTHDTFTVDTFEK